MTDHVTLPCEVFIHFWQWLGMVG